MKKIIKVVFLFFILTTLTGCLEVENLRFNENITAYEYAMEKYQTSRGISYTRIIQTREYDEESSSYQTAEIVLDTTILFDKDFNINKLHSEGELTSNYSLGNKEMNRYYIENNLFVYEYNMDTTVILENYYAQTYENYYDYGFFKLENIIPVFSSEEISDFSIEKIENQYFISFMAPAPDYYDTSENFEYEYVINFNGELESLYYKIENGENEYTYSLEVNSFNLFVEMPEFPSNFDQYIN